MIYLTSTDLDNLDSQGFYFFQAHQLCIDFIGSLHLINAYVLIYKKIKLFLDFNFTLSSTDKF